MKSLTRILFIAALAVLPLALAAPSQAARKMEVTIQDDGIFLYGQDYYNRDFAYLQARDLGFTTVRMNVLWYQTMPPEQWRARTKPAVINYNWAMWDAAIARAKQFGMRVQLDLTGQPPVWACGNKRLPEPNECKGYKPNTRHFREFTEVAARHFKGQVTRFSIWNEPNWYAWLSPLKQSPRIYRRVYQAGYKGVKAGNRRAKVFMGEFAPFERPRRSIGPLRYLREMVCVNRRLKRIRGAKRKCPGGALKLDGLATHPYDFTNPPWRDPEHRDSLTMANLGKGVKLLDALQKKKLINPSTRRTQLWLTEFGYFVRGSGNGRGLSESKRRRWSVRGFDMAQRNSRVKANLWYILVSPPPGHPSAYFDTGLIKTNGVLWGTFHALKGWVQNAARTGRVARPGPCSAC